MSPIPLQARDMSSTFSSGWSKCMSKTYCKWPVVAGIIIGVVILFAVLACVFNCLCCGYQCCKCCCSCCCPSGQRRDKSPKYKDEPQTNNNPYKSPEPPQSNYRQSQAPQNRQSSFPQNRQSQYPNQRQSQYPNQRQSQYPNQSLANVEPTPPIPTQYIQTAQFDISTPAAAALGDDALPEMPTWASATSKRIEHGPQEVEMALMKPTHSNQGAGAPINQDKYRGDPYGRRPSDSVMGSQLSAAEDQYGRRPSSGLPQDQYGRRPSNSVMGSQLSVATEDQYGRRPSSGLPPTQDPYGRRPSALVPPGAVDQYGRRSLSPQAAYNTPPDQYGRRSQNSPGYSPVSGPGPNRSISPYGPPRRQGSNSDYNTGENQYHPITASPVDYRMQSPPAASYQAFSPISEPGQAVGFQRQPSSGSQYPPSYHTQPQRQPSLASTQYPPSYHTQPPLPTSSSSPNLPYQPYSDVSIIAEPTRTRPPSLLQSGRKPVPNSFRTV